MSISFPTVNDWRFFKCNIIDCSLFFNTKLHWKEQCVWAHAWWSVLGSLFMARMLCGHMWVLLYDACMYGERMSTLSFMYMPAAL